MNDKIKKYVRLSEERPEGPLLTGDGPKRDYLPPNIETKEGNEIDYVARLRIALTDNPAVLGRTFPIILGNPNDPLELMMTRIPLEDIPQAEALSA